MAINKLGGIPRLKNTQITPGGGCESDAGMMEKLLQNLVSGTVVHNMTYFL